jgi:small ligand-binding sensory domain FIST
MTRASPSSAFIQAHASHPDWRFALAECRQQLQESKATGTEYTLGWCYLTDYFAPAAEAILAQLRQDFPGVAWTGTAGIGVAASGIEYLDVPAVVLMLAPLPRDSFRLFSGRHPLPGADSGFVPHTAQVHAEGSTPELQELLQELSERTATGYLFGGLSSARNRTFHLADGVLTGGLSGVAFSPQVQLISRVSQGCQPIGPVRLVTRAEGNYVISLNGRPALDCVLSDLGLDPATNEETLLGALAETLVGLSQISEDVPSHPGQFGADTVVRHLLGVDPDNRLLAIADRVETGMRLAFCTRNPTAARGDLIRIATEIRNDLDRQGAAAPAGAIYVSCSGRGGPHFGARNAELQVVQAILGEMPLAGFFAGGEIARHHLYGYTGVLTVFPAESH